MAKFEVGDVVRIVREHNGWVGDRIDCLAVVTHIVWGEVTPIGYTVQFLDGKHLWLPEYSMVLENDDT